MCGGFGLEWWQVAGGLVRLCKVYTIVLSVSGFPVLVVPADPVDLILSLNPTLLAHDVV